MIVNKLEQGWEVIYQPAHALLSAQLAGRWEAKTRPGRWWETLTAVAQHDNGWREWEAAPLITDEGAPRNFTQMTPFDAIAQWERGITRGRHQSRWVGLLISLHATSLYEARRGELAELDAFLNEQAVLQEAWIEGVGTTREEALRAYRMVQWTDWLSLILCWRRLPEGGKEVVVGEGVDGRRYVARRLPFDTLRVRNQGRVTVEPWPFYEAAFGVSVEARYLQQERFENHAELQAALANAPVMLKRWQVKR